METLIKTEKSFLNIHPFQNYDELINNCIKESINLLIVNPSVIVYGKSGIQHRDIGFFSNTSIGYSYSGQFAKSIPLTDSLFILINIINKLFNTDYNGILINKYKNGNDYIGPHSDDEKNLGSCGVISISIGAVRKFRIRDKTTKKIIIDIPTISNNIIHMGGNFQKEFTHEIPIEKKIKQERFSFTFRKHNK